MIEYPDIDHSHAFKVTSGATPEYNCVAWAMNDDQRWWEPSPAVSPVTTTAIYWPPGVPNVPTFASYVALLDQAGYTACQGAEVEAGFEKVALYRRQDGDFGHMARQLPDGRWTSKMGPAVDVRHDTVLDVQSLVYGVLFGYYRRPVR